MSADSADAREALRPPPGHPRFPLVDGLRAIAVLGVVLDHVNERTHPFGIHTAGDRLFTAAGPAGVAAFFAISAFLLYRPFVASRHSAAPRPSVRRFAWRRVLRVGPAYWLAITVFAIWPGIDGVLTAEGWRFYAFAQVYDPDTMRQGLIPAWSLDIEVAFYVVLALLALVARTPSELGILAGLAVAWLAIKLVFFGEAGQHDETLLGYLPWFLLGMAAAVASVRRPNLVLGHPSLFWAAAAAVFALTAIPTVFDSQLALRACQGVAGLLLCLPAFFAGDERRGPVRALLAHPSVAWLGLVSYGIYLFHYPLVGQLDPGDGKVAFLGLLALGGGAAVACAAASWYALERPLLRLGR